MSVDNPSEPRPEGGEGANVERREALIKLGKYTAYAAPVLLASLSPAQGQPVPTPAPPVPISDIRLKRDIVLLRRLDNGLGLYRYRYLWSDDVYVGVMAQEVARVAPQAIVSGSDGYLRVDYARLGMRLLTWNEWVRAPGECSLAAA